MSSDNATEAAVTPQEWLRGHASGIADRDGEVSLLNATIRELTVEIERLRVEANELRASRDAWSNRAMATQRALTERLCK
jgi:hypothetical protein